MTSRHAVLAVCFALALCAGCHRKRTTKADQNRPLTSEIDIGDKFYAGHLVQGFYESTGGWRWTARKFAVSLDAPQPIAASYATLDFSIPAELMNDVGDVWLTARVEGHELGRQHYERAGRYVFDKAIPLKLLTDGPLTVEFELNKATKEPGSGRELGLIAVSAAIKYDEGISVSREAAIRMARDGYSRLMEQRRGLMPLEKQQEMMKLFHELPVWRNMWFQNVQIAKNPLDLWMMQQIIYEVQPDFIIETGTWRGGSALYWAHTLNGMGLTNARVLTMDIADYTKTASLNPLWTKYVHFYLGSSTDAAIVSQIANLTRGHKTLVTLDSDHTMKHVLQEIQAYAPMVTRGSYLVVEDTHMDGVPTEPEFGPGPMAAVKQFLESGGSNDFEPDLTREALVMTFNPGGWLRRK